MLVTPGIVYAGFFDDLKESLVNIDRCNVTADYFSSSKGGNLASNITVYRGPKTSCRKLGRSSSKLNVKVIGEHAGWYYITLRNARGKVVKGWTQKKNITLQSKAPIKKPTAQKDENKQKNKAYKKLPNLYGITQDANKEIQLLLSQLGYDPGPNDGLPGRKTRTAIREFQTNEGVFVDGIPSYNLLKKLKKKKNLSYAVKSKRAQKTTSRNAKTPVQDEKPVAVGESINCDASPYIEISVGEKICGYQLTALGRFGYHKKLSRETLVIPRGGAHRLDKTWTRISALPDH